MLLNAVPIYGDDTVTITVTGEPDVSLHAPTNFYTTLSGADLTLHWTEEPSATSTIIVRSFLRFPQSVTDGAVIYNGTDESMVVAPINEQSPQYFFSAFSQKGATYSTTYSVATNGGMTMYLAIFLSAGAVFAFLAWRFRGFVMGIFAGALIIFAAYYTRSTPIPNIVVGSGLDTGIYLVILSFGIFTALISLGKFMDSSDGRSWLERAFGGGSESTHVVSHNGDLKRYKPNTSTMEGRAAAYRASIHPKLNQPIRRKR